MRAGAPSWRQAIGGGAARPLRQVRRGDPRPTSTKLGPCPNRNRVWGRAVGKPTDSKGFESCPLHIRCRQLLSLHGGPRPFDRATASDWVRSVQFDRASDGGQRHRTLADIRGDRARLAESGRPLAMRDRDGRACVVRLSPWLCVNAALSVLRRRSPRRCTGARCSGRIARRASCCSSKAGPGSARFDTA